MFYLLLLSTWWAVVNKFFINQVLWHTIEAPQHISISLTNGSMALHFYLYIFSTLYPLFLHLSISLPKQTPSFLSLPTNAHILNLPGFLFLFPSSCIIFSSLDSLSPSAAANLNQPNVLRFYNISWPCLIPVYLFGPSLASLNPWPYLSLSATVVLVLQVPPSLLYPDSVSTGTQGSTATHSDTNHTWTSCTITPTLCTHTNICKEADTWHN